MKKKGLKSVAFIGFADSYGDSWWKNSAPPPAT